MDEPQKLPPANWQDLNQVPAPRRKLENAKLTLEQINWLDARAIELGDWVRNEQGAPLFFNPDEGAARAEFMKAHHIENGQWLEGGE
jgi:hypothetical protein